ncbi:MAG TPA: Ig-like domain-containing protein [Syntrophomonadaceae bacterium]|nr:Ig-like domain-containing protein [Syntrophomonadaceae bacterium]
MPAKRIAIISGLIVIIALAFLIPGLWSSSTAEASTYKPDLTTDSATGITSDYATLNGEIDSDGNSDIYEYGFYWGTDSSCDEKEKVGSSIDEGDDFTYKLTGLDEDTRYYFKAYARNDEGISYGGLEYFTTDSEDSGDGPTVVSDSATGIGDDYGTLNGEIDSDGGSDITEYGFYWGTSDSCSSKHRVGSSIDEDDDFSYRLTDLEEDTRYYFKAYARNDDDISYGNLKSFTTGESSSGDGPSVTTKTPNVEDGYATLQGVMTSQGDSEVTSYGFYYGTTTSTDYKITVGTDSLDEDETFSYNLKDLEDGETYYVKAYATNSEGTEYGDRLSFTSSGSGSGTVPTLTTSANASGFAGAILTGTITSNGGSAVREYGFVWGKTGGTETKVNVGTSIAEKANFVYFLTGVQNGNSYYVKSYAINQSGTAYGPMINFTAAGSAGATGFIGTTGSYVPPAAGNNQAPVVVISTPGSGIAATRGTMVAVNATASDDVGVTAMGVYLNDVKQMCCGGNWIAYYLDTSRMSPGLYTIRVTAWDGSKAGEQSISINLK